MLIMIKFLRSQISINYQIDRLIVCKVLKAQSLIIGNQSVLMLRIGNDKNLDFYVLSNKIGIGKAVAIFLN